jgi:hypothetical protein
MGVTSRVVTILLHYNPLEFSKADDLKITDTLDTQTTTWPQVMPIITMEGSEKLPN